MAAFSFSFSSRFLPLTYPRSGSSWGGISCDSSVPASVAFVELRGNRIAGTLNAGIAALQSLSGLTVESTHVSPYEVDENV